MAHDTPSVAGRNVNMPLSHADVEFSAATCKAHGQSAPALRGDLQRRDTRRRALPHPALLVKAEARLTARDLARHLSAFGAALAWISSKSGLKGPALPAPPRRSRDARGHATCMSQRSESPARGACFCCCERPALLALLCDMCACNKDVSATEKRRTYAFLSGPNVE